MKSTKSILRSLINAIIVKMNEELKIRLFYVLSITAIVANTIGFISNAIIYVLHL